jgi:hypothetical protein
MFIRSMFVRCMAPDDGGDGGGGGEVSPFADIETFGAIGEDGRPANIPEKFWKEGNLDTGSLLKSHNYYQTKIGAADGFIGAPEKGYALPEKFPDDVTYAVDASDPLVAWFQGYAAENNLSQKAFEGIVTGYAQQQSAMAEAQKQQVRAEIDKLGPNGKGDEMIRAFVQQAENWMSDLPEAERAELQQGLKDAMPSAAAYKFMKFMEGKMQPANLPSNAEIGESGISLGKIREMQLEVYPADHALAGRRKYEVDPAFRDQVNALRTKLLGTGEHNVVMG